MLCPCFYCDLDAIAFNTQCTLSKYLYYLTRIDVQPVLILVWVLKLVALIIDVGYSKLLHLVLDSVRGSHPTKIPDAPTFNIQTFYNGFSVV